SRCEGEARHRTPSPTNSTEWRMGAPDNAATARPGRRAPRAQARPGARSARTSDRASAWQTRRTAQSPGLLRSGSPILLACAQNLAAKQIPNPVSVFAVLMTLLDLDIARPSQVDLDVGLDAAGTRREDDHAVGEIDRLVDVVGDEQHRLARRIPNLLQLLLQQ